MSTEDKVAWAIAISIALVPAVLVFWFIYHLLTLGGVI